MRGTPTAKTFQGRSCRCGCVCVHMCVNADVCTYVRTYVCVCVRVCVCEMQSSCFCQVFPWPGVLLVGHWSYEGEGDASLCLSCPHLSPVGGSRVHMGVGWAGCCAPLGESGLWGGAWSCSQGYECFQGWGEGDAASCVFGGKGWEGPPTWPWGSVVFYTCPPWQGWERLCVGGRGWEARGVDMLWIWHILSQP